MGVAAIDVLETTYCERRMGMLGSTREVERSHECDHIGERCALRH
jgi:hypothetical protein